MIYKISNNQLEVSINSCGACLTSLYDKKAQRELLYQIDPSVWTSQDIVIFPVIDQPTFKVNGKDFKCDIKHGVLREKECSLFEKEDDRIVLKFTSDKETLRQFPYNFEFYVSYTLSGAKLSVSYKVINRENIPMPCYVGGHPGLYAKDGKATIVFEKEEQPRIWNLDDGEVVSSTLFEKFRELNISKETLNIYKTYIFSGLKSSFLTMKTADVDYKFTFSSPVLGLWSKPHAGEYLCVEPWWGMAMQKGESREFRDKEFVNIVEDGKEFNYSIEIL